MKELTEQEYIDRIKSGDIDFNCVPVEKQTERMCLIAIGVSGLNLEWVKNQTEEMCFDAIVKKSTALKFVKKQTDEICLTAVTVSGSALQYVEKQTKEICLAAVGNYGYALCHVKEQTDEICLAAVRNYGYALMFVKKQNKAIYKEALNEKASSFIYVDADVYEYDKNEILKAFDDCGNAVITQKAASKTAKILSKLSDDDLVRAVNVDLKEIFINENLELSDGLANIKSKVDMMINVSCGDNLAFINKKPKII